MTTDELIANDEVRINALEQALPFNFRHSFVLRHSDFVIC